MPDSETKTSKHLYHGLTLLFWATLLEILLPNVIGFFNPFLHAFSKDLGYFPDWVRYIYPTFGIAAFAGVLLITLNSAETPKLTYLKRLLPSFAAITLLSRFSLRVAPKDSFSASMTHTVLETLSTILVAWYLKELCQASEKKVAAKSWLKFIQFYIPTAIIIEILSQLIQLYYTDLNRSLLYAAVNCLYIPIWIFSLRLLLKTRREIA